MGPNTRDWSETNRKALTTLEFQLDCGLIYITGAQNLRVQGLSAVPPADRVISSEHGAYLFESWVHLAPKNET